MVKVKPVKAEKKINLKQLVEQLKKHIEEQDKVIDELNTKIEDLNSNMDELEKENTELEIELMKERSKDTNTNEKTNTNTNRNTNIINSVISPTGSVNTMHSHQSTLSVSSAARMKKIRHATQKSEMPLKLVQTLIALENEPNNDENELKPEDEKDCIADVSEMELDAQIKRELHSRKVTKMDQLTLGKAMQEFENFESGFIIILFSVCVCVCVCGIFTFSNAKKTKGKHTHTHKNKKQTNTHTHKK